MGSQNYMPKNDGIAARVASSLDEVADRLETARDAGEFVSALEANGFVWREVKRMAPRLGWQVPARIFNFSLATLQRSGRGVDDHAVEAIIHINRSFSRELLAQGH